MNPQEILEYCDWLTAVLIPDLRTSGMDATADDFKKCVRIMRHLRLTSRAWPRSKRKPVPSS